MMNEQVTGCDNLQGSSYMQLYFVGSRNAAQSLHNICLGKRRRLALMCCHLATDRHNIKRFET